MSEHKDESQCGNALQIVDLTKNGPHGLFGEHTEALLGTTEVKESVEEHPNSLMIIDSHGREVPPILVTYPTTAAPGCAPPSLSIDMGPALNPVSLITPFYGDVRRRVVPHPHTIEGRLDALEKRFDKLLATIVEGECNERCDDNSNKPTEFDYVGSLKAQLEGFRAAISEMHQESLIYLNPQPVYTYRPQHWDDGL